MIPLLILVRATGHLNSACHSANKGKRESLRLSREGAHFAEQNRRKAPHRASECLCESKGSGTLGAGSAPLPRKKTREA